MPECIQRVFPQESETTVWSNCRLISPLHHELIWCAILSLERNRPGCSLLKNKWYYVVLKQYRFLPRYRRAILLSMYSLGSARGIIPRHKLAFLHSPFIFHIPPVTGKLRNVTFPFSGTNDSGSLRWTRRPREEIRTIIEQRFSLQVQVACK